MSWFFSPPPPPPPPPTMVEVAQQLLLEQCEARPITCALLAIFVMRSLVQRLTRPRNLPPFYSEFPYIPWLGSLWQFALGPREFLERAAAAKGSCFTIQLFGKPMTFFMGSKGHEHFFRGKEATYDIREAYAMTKITFGPGVCYDCPQAKMAQQFAFFKNGLSDECFQKYMALVQEEVHSFFEAEWGESGEADLLQSLSDLFTLTSSRCLLGDEIRSRWKSSGMAEHYIALDHSFVPILFFFPWIPNPHRSKCVAARTHFKDLFNEVIAERKRRAALPNGGSDDNADFLQVLMDAQYRDGTKLTVEEITGIMIGVLLGGQHTSNVTGTWLLCHLLRDPEWKRKVLEEQEGLLPDGMAHPAALSYEQVQQMPLMDQVLSETLRMHPPFFQLSRAAKERTEFNGYTIPKGHFVNISPGAAMRLPELWGDTPNAFDPSRFSPEKKGDIKPHAWIPFGGGLHACGGRKFAWNSLKVALTWLLRNYELEFVGGRPDVPKEDYTTMVVAPAAKECIVRYRRKTA